MAIEYVLNVPKKRLHVRVDGMSHEPCNLDQLTNFVLYTKLPDRDYFWCARCRKDHDAAT